MEERNLLGISEEGKPLNVLVIDDSLFVVKQLSQILKGEGFEIIESAKNGSEGVEKYKLNKDKIDLVTLDITMPQMDGISALKEIIGFDKEAKIIMISAVGKEDLVKESLMLGAKNFIVKPFDRQKVISRLESVLKK